MAGIAFMLVRRGAVAGVNGVPGVNIAGGFVSSVERPNVPPAS